MSLREAGAVAMVLAGSLACAAGCERAVGEEATVVVDEALRRDLQTIASARVFFGHHSVGANLLEGVAELARAAGVTVAIGEGPVGDNQQPMGKFEAWAKKAEEGTDAELFAMKLCFVDFDPSTNADELVVGYQRAVARVRQARPGVRILHITAPLKARPSGLSSWLKRTLGRVEWEDAANARRLAYNRALRAAFPGEPIFDLAAVESTRPDGSHEEHVVDGQPVPMLWPGYTSDGGHLNARGKRVAARAFIAALAEALRR